MKKVNIKQKRKTNES